MTSRPTLSGNRRPGAAAQTETYGIWGRAFRPFFLAAGGYGALVLVWWILVWNGQVAAPAWLIPMWWHGHEMAFAFVSAAMAGFFLTASPVWTGGPAVTGASLAGLVSLWVAGRIAFAAAGVLPLWLVAAVDLAFLPAVALAGMRTLWGSGQMRNYALVAIIAALALANAAMHAEALGLATGMATHALRFAIDLIVILLSIIGGRIAPAFTRNAFRRDGIDRVVRSWRWLDAVAIGSAAALAISPLVMGRGVLTGLLATIAGCAAAARVAGWQPWHTRNDALLWSLHAGLAWLPVGFLLVGASDLGAAIPPAAGLHALTAGAIGATILAVMTRVGLGHTGRPLVVSSAVVGCYALVHVAAIARVVAAFPSPLDPRALLVASSVAWVAAFGGFTACYWTILTQPRPDGKPG